MTIDAAPTERDLLSVEALTLHYPIRRGVLQRVRGHVRAVDGVSFTVRRGETLGLVGESGCGKSSLARAILRLQEPTSGTVRLQGDDVTAAKAGGLRKLRRHAQMVFQDPFASVNPRMRVADIIAEPMRIHGVGSATEQRDRVEETLEVVGLRPSTRHRFPHEFSGGQLQRVGIARALVLRPDFIVLDEPVSALDVSIQAQILNLLDDLQQKFQLTYLFVAHDLGVVRQVSTRIAVMYLGQIVELAERDELYRQARHPYTAALMSAVPIPDPARERTRRRIILRGDLPSPAAPPQGCRFHTRCWLRDELGRPERCVAEMPELRQIDQGRYARCHFVEDLIARSHGDAASGDAPSVPNLHAGT